MACQNSTCWKNFDSYFTDLPELRYRGNRTQHVVVEDEAVGAGSIVLQGVAIGRGAVAAAGTAVNKDVEPYTIVHGIPAKFIRHADDTATPFNPHIKICFSISRGFAYLPQHPQE